MKVKASLCAGRQRLVGWAWSGFCLPWLLEMDAVSSVYRLSLILSICSLPVMSHGSLLQLGTLVECWFVEEIGAKSSFPNSIAQDPALLLLRQVPYQNGEEQELPLDLGLASELKPGMFFDVRDYSRITAHPGFKQPQNPSKKPHCEINKYSPQESSVIWATHLTEDERTPAYHSSTWFCSHLQTFDHSFNVASVHRVTSGPRGADDTSPHQTSVVLNVFTRTPSLKTELKRDVLLDCGFAMDRKTGFAVEWRYQFKGSGHLVYAYNGAKDRVDMADEGTEMFFYELHSHGNASLLIRNVDMRHEGSYICTIYMPNLHAQQSIDLHVTEPPKLALNPDPLYLAPDQAHHVLCEISSYYPLDVSVSWMKRPVGNSTAEHITQSWMSGHRENPDGTFNVTSYISIKPTSGDHDTVYTCYVDHVSVGSAVRKSITLKVAGAAGPSIDDVIGLFICAFILCTTLKFFYWIFTVKVYPLVFNLTEEGKEKIN